MRYLNHSQVFHKNGYKFRILFNLSTIIYITENNSETGRLRKKDDIGWMEGNKRFESSKSNEASSNL